MCTKMLTDSQFNLPHLHTNYTENEKPKQNWLNRSTRIHADSTDTEKHTNTTYEQQLHKIISQQKLYSFT